MMKYLFKNAHAFPRENPIRPTRENPNRRTSPPPQENFTTISAIFRPNGNDDFRKFSRISIGLHAAKKSQSGRKSENENFLLYNTYENFEPCLRMPTNFFCFTGKFMVYRKKKI